MPKLSIIIPTFNSADTIERCLSSIAVQTFTDYEVIVQDGSPNDDTAREIERFQEKHGDIALRVFRERDRGPYDAMNKASARARGQWLYFLGSDDELFNNRVLAEVFEEEYGPDCDVIYGKVEIVGDCGWARSGSIYDGQFSLAKLLNKNVCHQAVFYRAEFARRVGEYDLRYPVCADWNFNLRCWAQTKFRYVDVVVAKFHAGGVSSANREDENLRKDFVANAMRYFNLSPFDPLINSPGFWCLSEVAEMQRANGKLHSLGGRAVRRLLRLRYLVGNGNG